MISTEAALIYTMVIVSAADSIMTDSELSAIGEIVRHLPVFEEYDANLLPETARSSFHRVGVRFPIVKIPDDTNLPRIRRVAIEINRFDHFFDRIPPSGPFSNWLNRLLTPNQFNHYFLGVTLV